MSFFETLKAMGLFPNQQAPSQGGGSYTAGNPYGLDPAMLSQARWASLGNISSQLLALGQQMTPQDRAKMMGNMDFTGGLQQNLMNAAQMKLAQRKMMQDDLATQQATDARAALAEKIKALPQGRLRDAAMFYLTAGDVDKAAEVIYKAEKRINPNTGEFELVNSFDLSPIGGAAVAPGGGPLPVAPGGAPAPATPPAPSADGTPAMPAAPATGTQTPSTSRDWVTRLTGDPNLSDAEVRQIAMEVVSKNDPSAGLTLYRQIRQQQQQAEHSRFSDQQALVTNFLAAPEVTAYNTLQQTLGSLRNAVYDGTRVSDLDFVYGVAKALDPNSVVRESEGQQVVDTQGIAPGLLSRVNAFLGTGQLPADLRLQLYNLVKRRAEQFHSTAAARREYFMKMGRGVLGPEGMPELLSIPANPLPPPPGGGRRGGSGGGNPPPVVPDGQEG